MRPAVDPVKVRRIRGTLLVWAAVGAGSVLAASGAPPVVGANEQPASSTIVQSPYILATKNAERVRGQEFKVYTNADLEALSGGITEPVAEAPGESASTAAAEPSDESTSGREPSEDPLAWLQEQQAQHSERRERVAAAEAELQAARDRLHQLEVQLLATRNPFSARPRLSPEEIERRGETGETAAERYDRTQQLVDQAREQVRAAEQALAQARAGS